MAIPIDTPEDDGPRVQPGNFSQSVNNSTIVRQLALELYSVYRDYCQSANHIRSRSSSVNANPDSSIGNSDSSTQDANNNVGPRRRRRHPAGRHGFLDASVAVTLSTESPNLQHDQLTDNDHELKLTLNSSFEIGLQLRQVADFYENRYSKHVPSKNEKKATRLEISATLSTSWPDVHMSTRFLLGSALLTISATIAWLRS